MKKAEKKTRINDKRERAREREQERESKRESKREKKHRMDRTNETYMCTHIYSM